MTFLHKQDKNITFPTRERTLTKNQISDKY